MTIHGRSIYPRRCAPAPGRGGRGVRSTSGCRKGRKSPVGCPTRPSTPIWSPTDALGEPKDLHLRHGKGALVPRAGGHGIVPMESRAGIVEGTLTPLLAKAMAQVVASTTPHEAIETFKLFGGTVPSTSSLDRLPKLRLSTVWEDNRRELEQVREFESVPAAVASVAVSLDGVLVPMRDGDRAAKGDEDDKRPQGPAGYHEAGCGPLTFYDADGERLRTIRHGRMPEANKVVPKEQLEAALSCILDSRPDLTLVGIADGSKDNWTFLEVLAARHEGDTFKVQDIFHARA